MIAIPPKNESAMAAQTTLPAMRDDDLCESVPLNVLIVYEDAAASRRALDVISRLAARTGHQVEFKTDFWRFDMLEDAGWRDTATRDVLAADMIILSTHETGELPPMIDRWLQEGLAQRGEKRTALLALFGTGDIWSVSFRNEMRIQTPWELASPAMEPAVRAEKESFAAACA